MKKACQRQLKLPISIRQKVSFRPLTTDERNAWVKDDDLYAYYKDM